MDDAKCRETILRMVSKERDQRKHEYFKAKADFVGQEASRKCWDAEHPEDGIGGPSGNPYRSSAYEERRLEEAEWLANRANELYEWTLSNIFRPDITKEKTI